MTPEELLRLAQRFVEAATAPRYLSARWYVASGFVYSVCPCGARAHLHVAAVTPLRVWCIPSAAREVSVAVAVQLGALYLGKGVGRLGFGGWVNAGDGWSMNHMACPPGDGGHCVDSLYALQGLD